MNDELLELQTQLSFQEDSVQQLNEVVTRQQGDIEIVTSRGRDPETANSAPWSVICRKGRRIMLLLHIIRSALKIVYKKARFSDRAFFISVGRL